MAELLWHHESASWLVSARASTAMLRHGHIAWILFATERSLGGASEGCANTQVQSVKLTPIGHD